jgi:hypothetical protein
MATTQITRIKNADNSETLKRQTDGATLPYSEGNLTTLLTGYTNPTYVLKNKDYPYTFQARNERV